jgi:hypothetical protein
MIGCEEIFDATEDLVYNDTKIDSHIRRIIDWFYLVSAAYAVKGFNPQFLKQCLLTPPSHFIKPNLFARS